MRGKLRPVLMLCCLFSLLICLTPAEAHDDHLINPHPTSAGLPVPDPGRTDVLTESFETSVPPPGWAMIDAGVGSNWFQTDFIAHSGTYCAVVAYDDPGLFQDEWLVTPALDFSTLNAPYLEFYEDEDYWSGYGLHHYVAVSTTSQTDPGAFTMILDMTPTNHTVNGFAGDPVTVSLAAYAGQPTVYVALRYTGDWADNWFVDDVRIYEPFEHDVQAVSVSPNAQFNGGDTIVPQAVVENIGQNTESFDVLMEISESGTPVYSQTVAVAALAVGDDTTVDFPGLTLNAGQYYDLVATTLLAGDMDPSNDTAAGRSNTYTRPRVPLGHLQTNAGCGPCAQANQALDAYMPGQGNNVALIRLHVWWPSVSDQMYQDNIAQAQAIANAYGADYAPHFWIDGINDVGSSGSTFAPAYEARKLVRSPMDIELEWNGVTEMLRVRVFVANPIPQDGDYRLRVSITEDNIYFVGGNGENIHNQAFRYMYPDVDGTVLPPTTGYHEFNIATPLTLPYWAYDELRATVYVQEENGWEVLQAATAFLHENPIAAFLSDFGVVSTTGGVDVHWQVSGDASPAEFTLLAGNGTHEWTVPFTLHDSGAFRARDEASYLAAGGEVTYSLYHQAAGGERELIGSKTISLAPTILASRLLGASPNPFNPQTEIHFAVDRTQQVRIAVYDLNGRLVAEVANQVYGPGMHRAEWNGTDRSGRAVASGTYFAQMKGDRVLDTKKLMLVR